MTQLPPKIELPKVLLVDEHPAKYWASSYLYAVEMYNRLATKHSEMNKRAIVERNKLQQSLTEVEAEMDRLKADYNECYSELRHEYISLRSEKEKLSKETDELADERYRLQHENDKLKKLFGQTDLLDVLCELVDAIDTLKENDEEIS